MTIAIGAGILFGAFAAVVFVLTAVALTIGMASYLGQRFLGAAKAMDEANEEVTRSVVAQRERHHRDLMHELRKGAAHEPTEHR